MFELNRLYNMDCMAAMQEIPDKFFELAICDPPYGIGIDGQKLNINKKNPKHTRKEHIRKNWDAAIPPEEYFRELERVSVNQVIWGGNYFVEHLTKGTKGWIVWDKGQHGLTMSDCELAYTSFNVPTRIIVMNRVELLKDGTFHPTQKPVKLYEWVISRYAKAGDKILDTHAGSGSCLVAAHRTQHDFLGLFGKYPIAKVSNRTVKSEPVYSPAFTISGSKLAIDGTTTAIDASATSDVTAWKALSRPEIRKSHSSSERQTGMQRTSKRRDISEPTRTNLLSSRSSRAGNGTNAPEH